MQAVKAANHEIFYTVEELNQENAEVATYYAVRIFPKRLGGTADYGIERLSDAARAIGLRELPLAKRFFHLAMECVAAGAAGVTAGVGAEVDYQIDGQAYRAALDGMPSLVRPYEYVLALTYSIALRASKVTDALLAVPISDIETASASSDRGFYRYVQGWRAFLQQAPDAGMLLGEVEEMLQASELRSADPKAAEVVTSTIPAMQALLGNDAARLNDSLVGALKAHKAWWGRGSRRNDPLGLLAHQSIALASLALQRGMNVTVTSDYMPRWFIEGRDPE